MPTFARKSRRIHRRVRPSDVTLSRTIKLCAEQAICDKGAATTEEIYYVLVPRVLKSGLATQATANGLDLVAALHTQGFLFNDARGRWEIPPGHQFEPEIPATARARAYLRQCLAQAKAEGRPAQLSSVLSYLARCLGDGNGISEEAVLGELRCVGRLVRDDLWELREASRQLVMF